MLSAVPHSILILTLVEEAARAFVAVSIYEP